MSFPHLFSPIQINSLNLKNRFVVSPHTTGFAAPDGYITLREVDYQEARARGGAALTVLGTNVVHRSSTLDYGVLANLDDSYIPGYQLVADAVHRHGAVIFVQLNHQGGAAARSRPQPLYAASAIPSFIHGDVPHVMDKELIHDIVRAFGAAAARCQRAGIDGVLVHAAHGFLLNQFLSPRMNHRTDEYGGSIENRMRMLLEVLDSIRAGVGGNYPVGVRLSVDEYVPGGLALDESLTIAERLDAHGAVDYLDVSCGVDYDRMSEARHYPGMYFPPLTWVELAAAIKRLVHVPVSCAGRIRNPNEAEQLLAGGKLDLVQMARALIADPDLPNKAREERLVEIRPCMYISSGCLGRLHRGLAISCVQNPAVGREREYGEIPRAQVARQVIVVGGGPAGMEAARVARLRGHEVTLFERESRLGGQMWIAAQAPGRRELLSPIAYLTSQLERLGVEVCLGTSADVELVISRNPDVVILATGSDAAPLAPELMDREYIYSVREVLNGDAKLGRHVAVWDGLGRMAAASAADYAASRGHQVTMIGRDYAIGHQIDSTTRPVIEQRLRLQDVRLIAGAEVLGFEDQRLILRDAFTGRVWDLNGIDTLVYDLGGRARDALYDQLCARGIETYRVGDCLAPRGLEEAYAEGFTTAFAL